MLLAVAGIAVRLFFIEKAEVRGGCASKNPMLQEEGVACGVCGRKPGEECKKDDMPQIAGTTA